MSKAAKTHTKRYGKHHKHNHRYVKVYAPYLPLFVSLIANLVLSFWQPGRALTLAYATEMSAGGLLNSTNAHRASNGQTALTLNQQLNAAAQAKANDMVERNYWSHNTPDGQEPWVFIDNAGYKYLKAGENLAYGFATSSDTVAGWMNSPTHKANMLDGAFVHVGFGFANSPSYNSSGQQTVVVAMYGKPQTLGATVQPSPPPVAAAPKPTPAPVPVPAPAPVPTPAPAAPAETKPEPVTTDQPVAQSNPVPQQVAKVQTITGGRMPWAFTALATLLGGLMIFWMAHHTLRLRHLLRNGKQLLQEGERLILHHPLLDATLLSFTILGLLLARTVGFIL